MDHATGKIVDFFIAQRGYIKEELEQAACREILQKLALKGITTFSLETDRRGIRGFVSINPTMHRINIFVPPHVPDEWRKAKSVIKLTD